MDILLNRVFTNRQLNELVKTKSMKYAIKAGERYGIYKTNLPDLISSLYKYLGLHHRNEYFYKNQILNKIVLGRHSVNTTSALRELPVAHSIADFIVINGKAQVYEIKTELDTLHRLKQQIKDYYKAFEYVNVITDEKYLKSVVNEVDSDVGIYVLTKRNQISCKRKAKEHKENLDSFTMFKILRKAEFEKVILDNYNFLPSAGASKYYNENFKLFSKLSLEKQQKSLTHLLKQRYLKRFKGKSSLIMDCPMELRELVYFSNLKDKEIKNINKILNK